MDFFSDLTWRGLVNQCTAPELVPAWLAGGRRTLYCGFDPTSDSLHVGSLLPVMLLRRFQKAGHRPIALVGGATGMIGDPTGKSEERNLLTTDQLAANVAGIKSQLESLLDFSPGGAMLLNNFDWMRDFSFLAFLRDVGKHFPVNVMLAKDSVKGRLASDAGISYTEFSYMLLQAYDFVHLHKQHGCELQVGGSDQWGNITAGIDLARRMGGPQLFGLTCPLLLKSDGQKMGKTEQGAVYLSDERTSPFAFYQYWIKLSDDDVGLALRFLTELPRQEIEALDDSRRSQPHLRESQKKLAAELTRLIHGEDGLVIAQQATNAAFAAKVPEASQELVGEYIAKLAGIKQIALELRDSAAKGGIPSASFPRSRFDGTGLPLVEAFVAAGLAKSKSEVRRLIEQGGCYVNDKRREDVNDCLLPADLIDETLVLLRSGKSKIALVQVD